MNPVLAKTFKQINHRNDFPADKSEPNQKETSLTELQLKVSILNCSILLSFVGFTFLTQRRHWAN